jgi:hypothetical protein
MASGWNQQPEYGECQVRRSSCPEIGMLFAFFGEAGHDESEKRMYGEYKRDPSL